MERSQVWEHIHAERRSLAAILADLPDEAWRHDTLCPGWTVHDVAAHVIAHPRLRLGELTATAARDGWRGYNQMIRRSVQRMAARQTRAGILADFAAYDGSTRTVPGTTHLEALIDVLVHTQDIVRPLGIVHPTPPDAAAVAADRALTLAWLTGWGAARRLRLVATDVAWTHGEGPLVEGPMQELLMVVTGRRAVRLAGS